MTDYVLYRQKSGRTGGRRVRSGYGRRVGTYQSLAEAMQAAGHTESAAWYSAAGIPDMVYVDWRVYYDPEREYDEDDDGNPSYLFMPWTIEAEGVAAEMAALGPMAVWQ